ncbi:MAG: MFS transporter [Candidatus Helarchaeota archaeon]
MVSINNTAEKLASLKKSQTFRDIFFMYVTIYICYGIIPVITDNLAYISIDYNEIGIIISVNFIVQTFSILFFGYYSEKLSKRFGRKKVFFITNLITFISYGLISMVQNFYQFLVLIMISAFFIGAFIPIGFSIISDMYPPHDRGKRYGLMSFGLVLGSGGGVLFATFIDLLLPSSISWRWAYVLGCLLGIWPTLTYGIRDIDPVRGESEPEFEDFDGIIEYDYKVSLKTMKNIFSKKTVLGILIYVLFSSITFSALGNWAITYWRDYKIGPVIANPELLAIVIYMIAGLGAIPGNLIGGKLGDKFYKKGKKRGRVYVILMGMIPGIFILLAFYLMPFPSNTLGEIIGYSILFIIIGFIGYMLTAFPPSNNYAMLSEVCIIEERSSANSYYGIMANIAAVFGNPLFTFLLLNSGYLFAMVVIFLFSIFGNCIWILPFIYYPKEAKKCRELIARKRKNLENAH